MDEQNDKIKYYVNRGNVFTRLCEFFMLMSAICRFIGYWGFWSNQTSEFIIFQIAVPIISCLLYCVIIIYGGRKVFSLTFIPVTALTLFFIIRAFSMSNTLQMVVSLCLYIAILFIYTAVVFGVIRSKWWLLPFFIIPLGLHIYWNWDMIAPKGQVSLSSFLPEASVMCIMFAMLFIVFAMKRRKYGKTEEQETIDLLMDNEEPPEGEEEAEPEDTEGNTYE